jgi:hypothetical protein
MQEIFVITRLIATLFQIVSDRRLKEMGSKLEMHLKTKEAEPNQWKGCDSGVLG